MSFLGSLSNPDDLYELKGKIKKLSPYEIDKSLTKEDVSAEAKATGDAINAVKNALIEHANDYKNPHKVTKTQLGLGNVDNTSDLDKPVSTAQAKAIADHFQVGETAPDCDAVWFNTRDGINAEVSDDQIVNGAVNMAGHRLYGLPTPTSDNDSTNKGYVDAQVKKAAPRNLLSNSDWTHPVNEKGVTNESYPNQIFIDRWLFDRSQDTGSYSLGANGITFGKATWLKQFLLLPLEYMDNKTFTAVLWLEDGTFWLQSLVFTAQDSYVSAPWAGQGIGTYFNGTYWQIVFSNIPNCTIKHVALYEGEYTADNVPNYQSIGYEAELFICRQYDLTNGNYIGLQKFGQPVNLLDNSDFTNPVNQRGVTSYVSDQYGIDRWVCGLAGFTATVQSDGMHMSGAEGGFWLKQLIPIGGAIQVGAKLTLVIKKKNTEPLTAVLTVPATGADNATQISGGNVLQLTTASDGSCVIFVYFGNNTNEEYIIEWAALYEGEYSAETLPEYQPRGYAAELAECMRYFQKYNDAFWLHPCGDGYQRETFTYPIPMRISPSITFQVASDGEPPAVDIDLQTSNQCVFSSANDGRFVALTHINFSADL